MAVLVRDSGFGVGERKGEMSIVGKGGSIVDGCGSGAVRWAGVGYMLLSKRGDEATQQQGCYLGVRSSKMISNLLQLC